MDVAESFDASGNLTGLALLIVTYSSENHTGMLLVRVSADLASIDWARWIDTSARSEEPNRVIQTADGGFLILGHGNAFSASEVNNDLILAKLDSAGNVQWMKGYGTCGAGNAQDEAWTLSQTSDGSYLIAGTTYNLPGDDSDVWFLKVDASGSLNRASGD